MLKDLKFIPLKGKEIKKHFKIWSRIASDQVLPTPSYDFFNEETEVFVIGSCFANEIRSVLERVEITVHPKIDSEIAPLFPEELKVAPSWGGWDERVHYQCYTPMSIQQEISQALGDWEMEDEAVIETSKDGKSIFWDPYRRSVYANSREDLLRIRSMMNERIRDGIAKANFIIITLGLVEAYRLKNFSGYAAELIPAFMKETNFENLSYEQAHAAVADVCDKINNAYPDKKIIISVSPIPLNRTFAATDVITATTRGKSILRVVADAVVEKRDYVFYWPSYEYVMWSGRAFREDDLRHVTPEIVNEITSAFLSSFFSEKVAQKLGTYSSTLNINIKGRDILKKIARKYLNKIRRKFAL